MSEAFNTAAADVRNLKAKPSDPELLELYSYFKQATMGDTATDRPGMLDVRGKAKWDAWHGRKGMSKEDAEAAYVKFVEGLKTTYGMASVAFNTAAADVKNLKAKPSDQELLDLYSYFKQATMGDTDTDRPGMLDFKGKAKWDAWNGRKGMIKDDAEVAYVKFVEGLKTKLGVA